MHYGKSLFYYACHKNNVFIFLSISQRDVHITKAEENGTDSINNGRQKLVSDSNGDGENNEDTTLA